MYLSTSEIVYCELEKQTTEFTYVAKQMKKFSTKKIQFKRTNICLSICTQEATFLLFPTSCSLGNIHRKVGKLLIQQRSFNIKVKTNTTVDIFKGSSRSFIPSYTRNLGWKVFHFHSISISIFKQKYLEVY